MKKRQSEIATYRCIVNFFATRIDRGTGHSGNAVGRRACGAIDEEVKRKEGVILDSKKDQKKHRKTKLAAFKTMKMKAQLYKLVISNFTEEDFLCPPYLRAFGKWYKALVCTRHQ